MVKDLVNHTLSEWKAETICPHVKFIPLVGESVVL